MTSTWRTTTTSLTDALEVDAATVETFRRYFRACGFPLVGAAVEDAIQTGLQPEMLVWKECTTLSEIAGQLLDARTGRDRLVLVQRAADVVRRLGALLD